MAFQITLHRMGIFFLVFAVGFVAGKLGVIKKDQMPGLAQIITKILLPVVIFYGTVSTATRDDLVENAPFIALTAAFYAITALLLLGLARLMRLPHDRDRVFTFCFLFGNIGFVGIPLLAELFPQTGMLYVAEFTVIDQAVFWTFGLWLATARDRTAQFSGKKLINPNIVAIVLAIAFVVAGIKLPSLFADTLSTIGSASSALCMMYLGAMACFSQWTGALKLKETYIGIAVKMVALPIVAGRLLSLLPLPADAVQAMVVIISLPVMTVVPMIVAMNGDEGDYATGITVVTLVAAVATIPLVQLLVFG